MKKRLLIFAGLIVIIGLPILLTKNPVLFVDRKIDSALAKADEFELRHHVEILAAAQPPRNFKNPESLKTVANYIEEKFQSRGLTTYKQEFIVDGNTYYNVITQLGPAEGEALVIGAHYDVAGDRPGADDNASGTAGLLEIARILAPVRDQLKRPIILVAYSLEEPPNFRSENMGSYKHAKEMKERGQAIKLMISLEMIGYFKDEADSQNYPAPGFSILYPTVGNYISIIGRPQEWFVMRKIKALFFSGTDLEMRSANIPTFVPGVDYSDQLHYWNLGFPAVMITDTAFMRNPNYHKDTDLPDTLDYRRMSEVVNGVCTIAVGL